MKRLALLLLACASVLWTHPVPAQTAPGAINGTLDVFIDGEKVERNSAFIFVGKSRCESGVEYEFEATYTQVVPVLELWVSQGKVDCSQAANRQGSGVMPATCWRVASANNIQMMTATTLTTTAEKLFSREGEACQEGIRQEFTTYLVPLESPTQVDTGTAPEPTAAGVYTALFTLYTQNPPAPTGVSGRSGEATLGVSWKKSSSADQNTTYRIYYDTAQSGEGDLECGSGVLEAGVIPNETKEVADSSTVDSKGVVNPGSSIPGDVIEVGEKVAVGVVTVDAAGNESPLSEIVCIERVETDGFYDRYQEEGGSGLEKCSMQAPGEASWSGLGTLTLLALALVARRRRTT